MAKGSAWLLRAAESVSDGKPLPPPPEGAEPGPELAGALQQLRVVERIMTAHHGIHASHAETVDPCSEHPEGAAPTGAPASRWGSLRIVEQIGHGGYGEVYRAFDPALRIDVALKLFRLDRDRWQDEVLLDEARRLAKVRHPNVLVVHGADRRDGRVGLWTELIEGRTLEQVLREQGPFAAEEATRIGLDLCRALAAVHGAGLLHRDVKTSNIMREKGGRIVLMDFSSVTERTPEGYSSGSPMSGTPLFMAPELFQGKDAGPASDIYALGVVLFRLVSGRFPVEAANVSELREKHAHGQSTPLRDVRADLPLPFVATVERALASDPARRFATAGELERALSPAPVPVPGPRARWWRGPLGLAAAAAALLAVFLLGLWIRDLVFPPFQVDASLYRAGATVEERLRSGAEIGFDDQIFLEIQATEDFHVYVLNEDEAGAAFVLFPVPGVETQNPLEGGVAHEIPGAVDGVRNFWEMSSAGGGETIVVIASREPLTDLEARIQRIPRSGPEGPLPIDEPAGETLRGLGHLAQGRPRADAVSERGDSRLADLFAGLSGRAAQGSGLWVWQIRLEGADR